MRADCSYTRCRHLRTECGAAATFLFHVRCPYRRRAIARTGPLLGLGRAIWRQPIADGGMVAIFLSTTQVLDAAVQTANALNSQTPFDFGIFLGDAVNSTQYNGLRWYIDTIDGRTINPDSSRPNSPVTGGPIDYMNAYQAAGLDRSIPWYQVMGNHDQFFGGAAATNDYIRTTLVGSDILNVGNLLTNSNDLNSRGLYMGVVDGTTPFGDVIGAGPVGVVTPPKVIPNPDRRSLATTTSTTLQWMREFFNTTSMPSGHGFTQANLDNDTALYTFRPKAEIPLRVIVFDDTCKVNPAPLSPMYYAAGCVDQARYDWLVGELEKGQAAGELMIIAAHIPVGPQKDLYDPKMWPALLRYACHCVHARGASCPLEHPE